MFQLRSKLSSRFGQIKSSASTPRHPHPALTPRMLYQPVSSPKNEPVIANVKLNGKLCKICGYYLDGYGPGLFYTQQKYKSALEQNETDAHDQHRPDNHALNEDILFASRSKNSFSECESGVRLPHQFRTLPSRSIYFDYAQTEDSLSSYRPSSREIVFPTTVSREMVEPKRDVCGNCLESSTTSSSDDSNFVFKKTASTATPRTKKSLLPEKNSKSESYVTQDLLLVRRIASIFIFFNGFKPSLRMSATSFRNMARKCRLCESGAMPAIDILFIDIMRQWQRQIYDHTVPYYDSFRIKNPITSHQTQGLPFQGFLEAIFRIAKARFKGGTLKEKLENLVNSCEQYMKEASRAANKNSKKMKEIPSSRSTQMTSPRVSCGMSTRQPYF